MPSLRLGVGQVRGMKNVTDRIDWEDTFMAIVLIALFGMIGGLLAVAIAALTGGLSLWLMVYFFMGTLIGGAGAVCVILIKYFAQEIWGSSDETTSDDKKGPRTRSFLLF